MRGTVSRDQVIVFAEFGVGAGEREPVALLGPIFEKNLLDVANLFVVLFLKIREVQEYVPIFLDRFIPLPRDPHRVLNRLDHIVVALYLI